MDSPVINPIPVCEAKTGFVADPRGFAAAYCYQTRGLRSVTDPNGHRHYFCAAKGHAENVRVRVRRNYGTAAEPQGVLTEMFGR